MTGDFIAGMICGFIVLLLAAMGVDKFEDADLRAARKDRHKRWKQHYREGIILGFDDFDAQYRANGKMDAEAKAAEKAGDA